MTDITNVMLMMLMLLMRRTMELMIRRMLGEYNSNQLIHFGHRFKALGVSTAHTLHRMILMIEMRMTMTILTMMTMAIIVMTMMITMIWQ